MTGKPDPIGPALGPAFLLLAPAGDSAPFSITVVLNWTAGLEK